MAGCKPEYLFVVLAAVEAFNRRLQHPRRDGDDHGGKSSHRSERSYSGADRHEYGAGSAGSGHRANATIGRARGWLFGMLVALDQ